MKAEIVENTTVTSERRCYGVWAHIGCCHALPIRFRFLGPLALGTACHFYCALLPSLFLDAEQPEQHPPIPVPGLKLP